MRALPLLFVALFIPFVWSCQTTDRESLDFIGREYVLLALQLNVHDPGYVDAFYGDAAWREEAESAPAPLPLIRDHAEALLQTLERITDAEATDVGEFSRARFLQRHVSAMLGRIGMLEGKSLSFDEEALLIYDSRPPHFSEAHFDSVLTEIASVVKGQGSLTDRVNAFRSQFVIPAARLDTVFRAAMKECRDRTIAHIELPPNERFTLEYVTDKPWSGYNWFKGKATSLIQVNTDAEIFIDRAVDIACHEGYPGHHVLSILREMRYRKDGWAEFSMLPLYAPIAPIAEGSANYGKQIAFPDDERTDFEKNVLFPLAGLDATKAGQYYRLLGLLSRLSYAQNEGARKYLDGEWDADQTIQWLMKYQLRSEERARQAVRFIDTYRAYVINYNYGQDLVAHYIEERAIDSDEAWDLFARLLAAPVVPSDLY